MTDNQLGIAFFDVDDTLITIRSTFRFLKYYLPPAQYRDAIDLLDRMAASGAPRTRTNLKYYELFAGHDVRTIAESGRSWFASELSGGSLFRPELVAELEAHRAAGLLTVLVSGSFPACLDPIRRHVGADILLCTVLETVGDVYTGRVLAPMIGEAKAIAARKLMADRAVLPEHCYAYGDHPSDLPLLRAVGNPVAVGADPVLMEQARSGSWRRLAKVT